MTSLPVIFNTGVLCTFMFRLMADKGCVQNVGKYLFMLGKETINKISVSYVYDFKINAKIEVKTANTMPNLIL